MSACGNEMLTLAPTEVMTDALSESTTSSSEGVYTRDGEYVYFGEYPQTVKADDVTVAKQKDSRGYYLGSDGAYYYAKVVAVPDSLGYTFSNGTTITNDETYGGCVRRTWRA